MKATHISWIFTLFCCLSFTSAYSQLTVTTGATATQYAQEIVGPGVTVSNVTYSSNNSHQIGAFSNGASTNIGIDNGVILSTGDVADASGTASSIASGVYTSTGCGFLGMSPCPTTAPDLSSISGQDVYDVSVLAFDFTPSGPTISFQFVFGSDEYPGYVDDVNDAFGIFLTGPGISGPYSNNGVNIAIVPNTTTAIAINNVNDGYAASCVNPGPTCTNCAYYVNNCSGTTIQYNGFTTVITATYAVQCGQTYHIKFAVGDATDGILDSGVFIKGESLESGIEITPNPVSICQGDATSLTANVVGASGGTYAWQPGGQTTSSITVTPSTTTDYIATYTKNGCSISDTVTVTVNNCGCTAPDETIDNLAICSGDNVDLNTAINSSSDPATKSFYTTQSDANNAANAISNTVSAGGTYWVRAENPTDPTCFNVYEIDVTETTVAYMVDNQTNPTCGNTDGALTLSASGGSSPYTFSIDNGTTTQSTGDFTGLAPGNYSVLIKDDNGCQVTGSETITQQNAPTIDNLTPTNPSCHGVCDGKIQVSVSGGATPYTYAWTNASNAPVGSNANTINGLCNGTYNLTVTDFNNCQVVHNNIALMEPSQIVSTFYMIDHCAGTNSPASNMATSGGSFAFNPDPGDGATVSPTTGAISNGVGGTTYTVEYTVMMNGCSASSTQDVTVFGLPIYTASLTDAACGNANGAIDLTTSAGAAPFTFSIDNGTTTQGNGSFSGLSAGNYAIDIVDNHSCEVTGSATLLQSNQPTISTINATNPSCYGKCDGTAEVVVSGGTTPYSYAWTATNTSSVGSAAQATGLCEGAYAVTVTDSAGCVISGTTTLVEPSQIDSSFTVTDYCAGSMNAASAIATPGGLFSFNPDPGDGATIDSLTGTISDGVGGTTYTVQYEAIVGGCSATSTEDLTVNPVPSPAFKGDSLNGCAPLGVHFTDTSNFSGTNGSCVWDFGDGTTVDDCSGSAAYTYNSSGMYSVSLTMTSAEGCEGTTQKINYINVAPQPVADFTANPMVLSTANPNVNLTNESTGATNYIWSFGDDSPTETAQDVSHKYTTEKSQNYIVTLIAYDGNLACSDTTNRVIRIKEQVIYYVPNTFTPDHDNFNETFQPIFASGYDPYSYTLLIYNRWGELLFESHNVNVGWDGTYGGKIVPDGSYVWKITFKEPKSMSDKHHTKVGHVTLLR